MNIKKIIEKLELNHLLSYTNITNDFNLADLTYDSRKVVPMSLFICKGQAFKEEYLVKAKEKGAIVYLSEVSYDIKGIDCIIVSDIRRAMAIVSDVFYESPWQALEVIGITGTKGKSTTTMFLESILNVFYAPMRTGLSSSLSIYDGSEEKEAVLTTPENLDLFYHLSQARKNHLKSMLIEVSSQALKYHRVGELIFSHGVFLNIGEDHIGPLEHSSFEDYFESKLQLLHHSKKAYINLNTENLDVVLENAKKAEKIITFAVEKKADYTACDIEMKENGFSFKVKAQAFEASFYIPVLGKFNIENALASIIVASEM